MINLDINFTKEDLEVLGMMDFDQDIFDYYGSYSLAVKLGSLSVDENYFDGIKAGEYPELQEKYEQFKIKRDVLVNKLEQAEGAN